MKINFYGQYFIDRNSKTELVDFEFKGKTLPKCDEAFLPSVLCGRYFDLWNKEVKSKGYIGSKPVIANFGYDIVKEDEHTQSCHGEDILKMSWERLQDFATECSLIDVPYVGQSGFNLKSARLKAAFVYLRDIEGVEATQMNYQGYLRANGGDPLSEGYEDGSVSLLVLKMKPRLKGKGNDIVNIINNLNSNQANKFGEVEDLTGGKQPTKGGLEELS